MASNDDKVQKLQSDSPAIRVDDGYPDVAYLTAGDVKYVLNVNGDGTLTIDLRATKRNQAICVEETSRSRLTVGATPGDPDE